jgi:hypothetical protein
MLANKGNSMKQYIIKIKGKTLSDVENTLKEVTRLISEDYIMGADKNDDSQYNFVSTGEFEEEKECRD